MATLCFLFAALNVVMALLPSNVFAPISWAAAVFLFGVGVSISAKE